MKVSDYEDEKPIKIRIGHRHTFEATASPSIRGDKFLVLHHVNIKYVVDPDDDAAVGNMQVITLSKKSRWRNLRSYDRVQYTARVRDWTIAPSGHLYVSIERPLLKQTVGIDMRMSLVETRAAAPPA